MKNHKNIIIGAAACLVAALLLPELALAARDLQASAQSAVSYLTIIAKGMSVFGILASAVLYQFPAAAQFAKSTLVGGLIGAGLSFAGPSLLNAIKSIFGV